MRTVHALRDVRNRRYRDRNLDVPGRNHHIMRDGVGRHDSVFVRMSVHGARLAVEYQKRTRQAREPMRGRPLRRPQFSTRLKPVEWPASEPDIRGFYLWYTDS